MSHSDTACRGRENTIHRFLDDDLTAVEQAEFLNHLPQCAACQRLFTELQSLFADLAMIETVAPPAGIASAVMARLPEPAPSPLRSPLGRLALGGQIIIGLILLLLAGWLLLPLLDEWLAQISGFEGAIPPLSPETWLTDLSSNISTWLETWSPPAPALTLDIPADSLLILIPILTLAWLLGNGLLLRRYLSTPKNGGPV